MFWLEVVQFIAVVILFICTVRLSAENFNKSKEIAELQKEVDSLKYTDAKRDFEESSRLNHGIDLLVTTLNRINKNYRVTNKDRMNLLIFMSRFIDSFEELGPKATKIITSKFNTYKSGSEPLYNYVSKSLYLTNLSDEQISEILSAIYYLVTK